MTGKVLELESILEPDRLACRISDKWLEWNMMRQLKLNDWEEIRRYVFATDTTQTSNSSLPWKNKTTVPKLCQIADNLYANYTATLFPQRKWLIWEANERDANQVNKRDAIINYMAWAITQPSFKEEMDKVILDYIHYGNCFVTVDWADERVQTNEITQTGYIGPVVRRISPLDQVMNPTAESYKSSPKVIKSIVSMGEIKDQLEKLSNDENREAYEELWSYMKKIRHTAMQFEGELQQRDALYTMDGFTSFREYLGSDCVEVLTFYGDLYDPDTDTFLKNHVIQVVDRHRLITKQPNPSFFGYPPIFHSPWRRKQDNLWGMGPLDNLVGLQYRMDHLENLKADVMDLTTFPVQKVRGFVEDFTWQPGEKIFVGEEGDVEIMSPDVNALQVNFEIQNIERQMEEYAGAPREAMGFRTPGEKTMYEVQRLENAAGRVFQAKIAQFEEQIVEPILNAMLELARRNMTTQSIRIIDDELSIVTFATLTPQDLTGVGRLKPVAARNFAEKAERIQNITNFWTSGIGQDQMVQQHFSSIKIAEMVEDLLDLE